MKSGIQLLDIVALMQDISEHQLSRGQVGTVVEELSKDVVLVEFCDDDGQTYAMCSVHKAQLMGLIFEPTQPELVNVV